MREKKIFRKEYEQGASIMFLAERQGKIRLMCYKIDPWEYDDDAST